METGYFRIMTLKFCIFLHINEKLCNCALNLNTYNIGLILLILYLKSSFKIKRCINAVIFIITDLGVTIFPPACMSMTS